MGGGGRGGEGGEGGEGGGGGGGGLLRRLRFTELSDSTIKQLCSSPTYYYLGVAAKYRNAVSSEDLESGSNARA